jgi:hypothetical protein
VSAVPAGSFEASVQKRELTARAEEQASPEQRLAISRARIRDYLENSSGRRKRGGTAAGAAAASSNDWFEKVRKHPVAGAVVDAVMGWWHNHPLHAVGTVAGAAARDAVGPLARRHPVAMVSAAVLLGALVVWTRPWRLVLKSALFAGLASQVAARLVAQVPLESVLNAVMRFANRASQPAPPPAPAPSPFSAEAGNPATTPPL